MTHAAVVGSLNTDLVTRAARIPGPGETLFGSTFTVGFGGKGANQAVIFKRLGGATDFIGAVGADSFGRDYIAHLTSVGISVSNVAVIEGVSTGCAPIWVDETDGENRILVVPGANMRVHADRVHAVLAASPPSAVICQNEINLDATLAALEEGHRAGSLTVLTPAPVPSSPYPPSLLPLVSILVLNAHEAEAMAGGVGGGGAEEQEEEGSGTPLRKAGRAAAALVARGCAAVVVTLGPHGCLVCAGGGGEGGTPVQVHVPGVRLTSVVDTTGAGDAFSGSLAYFTLLLGGGRRPSVEVLVEAAGRACYVAALSCTGRGTQSSYPARDTLPAVLFDAAAQDARTTAIAERPL